MLSLPSPRELMDPQGLASGLTLPMALTATLRLTPEEFAEVYAANPDAVLELAADGSLVALERWRALSEQQRRGFAPLCPDLVVELASPNAEGPRGLIALPQKMAAYQRKGSRLGWLLIPEERAVEVWGPLQAGSCDPTADRAGFAPLR
jgi:Uma2 family endonuclease